MYYYRYANVYKAEEDQEILEFCYYKSDQEQTEDSFKHLLIHKAILNTKVVEETNLFKFTKITCTNESARSSGYENTVIH